MGKITDLCNELIHFVQTSKNIPDELTVGDDQVKATIIIDYQKIEEDE